MIEKTLQFQLGRCFHFRTTENRISIALKARLHPLIRHKQYSLRDVERCKGRINRECHQFICEANFLIAETKTLTPKHDASLFTSGKTTTQFAICFDRAAHLFKTIALACCGGINEIEVSKR